MRHVTSLGIRHARKQVYAEALGRGVKTITTSQLKEMGPDKAISQIPEAQYIYVTLDIDVLDPTSAPGTGTPVIGGLSYFDLRDILVQVPRRGRIVGMDVVEVAPPYDVSQVTAMTAARLIIDLLGYSSPPGAEAMTGPGPHVLRYNQDERTPELFPLMVSLSNHPQGPLDMSIQESCLALSPRQSTPRRLRATKTDASRPLLSTCARIFSAVCADCSWRTS